MAACTENSRSELNLLDIVERSFHPRSSEWIFLRELRTGTGRDSHSLQRLDAFALSCKPYQGMKRICYEMKASRADFLCEMKNPLKRRIGMRFSNEFYFVTPAGLLSIAEIPTDCGLIEVDEAAQSEWSCRVIVAAPWRDTLPPTWQFAAAMLRNQRRTLLDNPPVSAKQQKFDFS